MNCIYQDDELKNYKCESRVQTEEMPHFTGIFIAREKNESDGRNDEKYVLQCPEVIMKYSTPRCGVPNGDHEERHEEKIEEESEQDPVHSSRTVKHFTYLSTQLPAYAFVEDIPTL